MTIRPGPTANVFAAPCWGGVPGIFRTMVVGGLGLRVSGCSVRRDTPGPTMDPVHALHGVTGVLGSLGRAASASERQTLHVPVAVRSRSCLRHHPRCPLGLDVDEAGGGERAASRSARTTRPGASAGMASRRRRMSSARQPAAVSGTTSPGTSARIPRAAGWRSTASTAGSSPEGDALPRTPDGGPAGPVVSGGGAGGAGSAAPQPAAAVERVLVRP